MEVKPVAGLLLSIERIVPYHVAGEACVTRKPIGEFLLGRLTRIDDILLRRLYRVIL